jgi:hypothetical protein
MRFAVYGADEAHTVQPGVCGDGEVADLDARGRESCFTVTKTRPGRGSTNVNVVVRRSFEPVVPIGRGGAGAELPPVTVDAGSPPGALLTCATVADAAAVDVCTGSAGTGVAVGTLEVVVVGGGGTATGGGGSGPTCADDQATEHPDTRTTRAGPNRLRLRRIGQNQVDGCRQA